MPKLGIGLRYLFLSLLVIAGLAGFWLSGNRQQFNYIESGSVTESRVHMYDNPSDSINTVHITAYYFVPKNKKPLPADKWIDPLKYSLERISRFHKNSFLGKSVLSYDIVSDPVIGEKDSIFYDTNNTNRGNPEALKNISAELKRRFPEKIKKASREVTYVVYEGVGASGGDDTAILSSKYLTGEEYSSVKETLVAHEFYHTLGFPDNYDETGASFQNDIMGNGRDRALSLTFILPESLKHTGI